MHQWWISRYMIHTQTNQISRYTVIFYVENSQINYGDKKPWGLRPLIYNSLFEIKLSTQIYMIVLL